MATFAPTPQPIGFIIGQRMRVVLTMTLASQGPITGFELSFFVIDSDGEPVFEKNLADGVTVLEEGDGSGVSPEVQVDIEGNDTINLTRNLPPHKRYEWALWRTDASDPVPMAYGPFTPVVPPTVRPFDL